ncbi:hypothetical protein Fcan01_24018 [Folsomia candida]|uniref:Uncharacterized protein n=1 Tax=Folsomia candida TaxID=158441 RepID=A0A226D6I2_FOLCA|nr:hypothetical protein Fcan01_24018 [Folsomia candida]
MVTGKLENNELGKQKVDKMSPYILIFAFLPKFVMGSELLDFGTSLSPKLHNFLATNTLCRQKIMSNGIHSENLPHTKGTPIELGLIKGLDGSYVINRTMSNIFQDRRWTCVNVLIYCNYNDTNLHNYYWKGYSYRIHKALQNINLGYKHGSSFYPTLPVYDYFSVLVITNLEDELEFWKSWEPTYVKQKPGIFPNFKILLLKQTNVKLCVHSKVFSLSRRRNFICEGVEINPEIMYKPNLKLLSAEPCWNLYDENYKNSAIMRSIFWQILNMRENLTSKFHRPCEYDEYYSRPTMQMGDLNFIAKYVPDNVPLAVIHFTHKSLNYISCFRKEAIVYSMYVKPLDLSSWTLLFSFLLVISILTDLFIRYHLKINLAPSSFLFFLGSIIDEPSNPPNSEVGRNPHFRLGSIWWLLASIVATNGYISFLVTNLNAPFPPKIFDTVESLYCQGKKENLTTIELIDSTERFEKRCEGDHVFHPNATLDRRVLERFNLNNVTFFENWHRGSHCFSILSNRRYDTLVFHPWSYELHDSLELRRHDDEFQLAHQFYSQPMRWYPKKLWTMKLVPFASKLLLDVKSYMKYYNSHYLQFLSSARINDWIEEEVVTCGKSVFFADSERIELQRQNFERSYPKIKFYVGTEPLLKEPLHLSFYSSIYSKVPRLFETATESGLIQVLYNNSIKAELKFVMNNTKRIIAKNPERYGREGERFKSQKLESSLVTLFVISGVLIGLGFTCFVAEYGKGNGRRLVGRCLSWIRSITDRVKVVKEDILNLAWWVINKYLLFG